MPRSASYRDAVATAEKPKGPSAAPTEMVPYFKLYRFATALDYVLIVAGALGALGHGVMLPAFSLLFGDLLNDFNSAATGSLTSAVNVSARNLVFLGIGTFVLSYMQVAFFVVTAQRQSTRLRLEYFRALLRMEMGWYDSQETGALTSRISDGVTKVQDALGDKVGAYLQFMGTAIAGIIVAFSQSWRLTLVILSILPLLAGVGYVFSKFFAAATSAGQANYANAGAAAYEVIGLIRTVIAFGTERRECARYDRELASAARTGIRSALFMALAMGCTMAILFFAYGLGFFYGAHLVRNEMLSAGHVFTTIFSILMASFAIGQAAPNLAAFAAGRGAAVGLFSVLDRASQIDALSEDGLRPATVTGHLRFENVTFRYPTRPHEVVLDNFSLDVPAGQTVALVGASGCGKSTLIALLGRNYDVDSGRITLDGVDLRDLNVQWLRSQSALVSQQPVLFPTSIKTNLAIGKDGATDAEVEAAARAANAHDFITAFPQGYQTPVGDLGSQISGGQRQRLAIARALVHSPRLLFLDEATSALDAASEAVVQEALDKAAAGRTTLVTAHRLSSIKNSDLIVVLKNGRVLEKGNHEELIALNGEYAAMVGAQHGLDTTAATTAEGAAHHPRLVTRAAAMATQRKSVAVPSAASETEAKKTEDGGAATDGTLAVPVEAEVKEELPPPAESLVRWAMRHNRRELPAIFFGALAAICEGGVWPSYSILFSAILAEMLGENRAITIRNWVLGFIGLGFLVFIILFTKLSCLGFAGERLTQRLRSMSFEAIVHQPVAFFDEPANSKGVLTTRLASDASAVRGLVGDRVGMMLTLLSSIIVGIVIAMVYSWRVGLVVLSVFPILVVGGTLQMKLMTGFGASTEYEASGKFAAQSVENIRTVISLGRVNAFLQQYASQLAGPSRRTYRVAVVQAAAFAFTEFVMFSIWALGLWYGSRVVADGHSTFDEILKAFTSITFSSFGLGQIMSVAPDAAKAQLGAHRIYTLLARRAAQKQQALASVATAPAIVGRVEFQDVHFTYPARPDAPVLRGVSFTVEPGQSLALVGASGSGKSTIVGLVERFYEPTSGHVIIDGVDAAAIATDHLRKHVAMVSQEPKLFATTVLENIRYGLEGDADGAPLAVISPAAVEAAAREANAHEFISQFTDGYDTLVGEKGHKLSGGQCQRVAIARALLRAQDIKILLLDEATSALDRENERLVQEALDRMRAGRTTIIVAHRLSTVKNCNKILVLQEGVVVESGTHDELMAKNGAYYALVNSQQFVEAATDVEAPAGTESAA